MSRSLALLFGALLLSIGSASLAGASPGCELRVADDTVYVVETAPMVQVHETELETLVLQAVAEAEALVAATGSVEPDSTVEMQAAAGEPRVPSSREASPQKTIARSATRNRDATPSSRTSSGVKEGISVAGLIIDRTHSVIGRDFKDAFHNHWSKPEDASSFTILIAERPLPQFGSQIRVSVGETAVYQGQLRPGYRQIEKAAQQAAARARYYLREFYEPREVY